MISKPSRFPGQARLALFLLALMTLALMGPPPVRAAALSAVVAEVSGPVELLFPDGKRQALKQGDRLEANHAIESGQGGRAILQLEDGSKVEVFQATRISINEILPAEESKFSVSLFFGRVVAKLKKLRGDDVVITPTMVAGVRGTEFSLGVAEDGASVVSVNDGRVSVSTDKAWDQTSGVQLEPGQEVQADKAGAELTPRPIQAGTMDDWQVFRKKRLEALKADLPGLIARLEKGLDPNLAILDKIKAMPVDRAAILKKLDERLAALGPADVAERAKLTIQTHMEASNVLDLVRRFRVQKMRLESTFVQSERLKAVLPTMAQELGPQYQSMNEGLKRILDRKEEVMAKQETAAKEFKDSIDLAQPFLNKFKGPQFDVNK